VEVNRSGKCEGPGGGDRRGALCTGFTLITYMYNVCFLLMYLLMRDYWIPKWSINAFPLTMMKISKGTHYSTKALRPNIWMLGFYVIFSNYYYLSKVKLFQFFHYSKTHCFNSSSGYESWKTYSTIEILSQCIMWFLC
jgi:hypothetical protein